MVAVAGVRQEELEELVEWEDLVGLEEMEETEETMEEPVEGPGEMEEALGQIHK